MSRAHDAVGPVRVRLSDRPAWILAMIEDDLSTAEDFLEMDSDDVRPLLEGRSRERLLISIQGADVDRQRSPLADRPMVAVAIPVSTGQLACDVIGRAIIGRDLGELDAAAHRSPGDELAVNA